MDVWATDLPIKPGWYWHRTPKVGDQPVGPVQEFLVYEWQGGLCATVFDDNPLSREYHHQLVGTIGGMGLWYKDSPDHRPAQ